MPYYTGGNNSGGGGMDANWGPPICTQADFDAITFSTQITHRIICDVCLDDYMAPNGDIVSGQCFSAGSEVGWADIGLFELGTPSISDAINIGAGTGEVFAQVNNNVLEFRTLESSDGSVVITTGVDTIDITVPAPEPPEICDIFSTAPEDKPAMDAAISACLVPLLYGKIPHSELIDDEPERHTEIDDVNPSLTTVFSSQYVLGNFDQLRPHAGPNPKMACIGVDGQQIVSPVDCADVTATVQAMACMVAAFKTSTINIGDTLSFNGTSFCAAAPASGGGSVSVVTINTSTGDITHDDGNGNLTTWNIGVQNIVDNGDNTYTATLADGSTVTWSAGGTGGAVSVLTDNGDGTYTHDDGNGTLVTFDTGVQDIVDNGDGTFTATLGDGTTITWSVAECCREATQNVNTVDIPEQTYIDCSSNDSFVVAAATGVVPPVGQTTYLEYDVTGTLLFTTGSFTNGNYPVAKVTTDGSGNIVQFEAVSQQHEPLGGCSIVAANCTPIIGSYNTFGSGKFTSYAFADDFTYGVQTFTSSAPSTSTSNAFGVYNEATSISETRLASLDWPLIPTASAVRISNVVILGDYAYVHMWQRYPGTGVSGTTEGRIYRYDKNNLAAGGTLMTGYNPIFVFNITSGILPQTGAMTSDGTLLLLKNIDSSGNVADNNEMVTSYSISGTSLSIVNTVVYAGSTDIEGPFFSDYAYDNSGTYDRATGALLQTGSYIQLGSSWIVNVGGDKYIRFASQTGVNTSMFIPYGCIEFSNPYL